MYKGFHMLRIFLLFIISITLHGVETDYFHNDTDYPIPDNNPTGIVSEINISISDIPAEAKLEQVCYQATVEHTWKGDLNLEVISPLGTVVIVVDATGSESGTFTFSECNTTGLTEETIIGTWKLHVFDNGYGDTGTLRDWAIKFTYNTDSDGDGIYDANDTYPNDGPLGDWDGDGILNKDDPDDSDGFGSNDPRAHYLQGAKTQTGRIPGKHQQDTQPYPGDPCGQDHDPCIQGTQELVLDPEASQDPGPYPPLCPSGQRQIQQGAGCVINPECTDADSDTYFSEEGCGTAVDCNDENFEVNPGASESCNGIDDNCDAQVDEGFNLGDSCGTGACTGGTVICSDNGTGATCSTYSNMSAEVCNGLDDDCDGQVDEPEDLSPPPCSLQAGVCSGSVQECGGASGWLACDYLDIPEYEVDESTCDNRDNDCDAQTDEGCPP